MAYYFDTAAAHIFNLDTQQWKDVPFASEQSLGSRFYVLPLSSGCMLIGGHSDHTLNRLLLYAEDAHTPFTQLKPMMSCRADLAAVCFQRNVYVVGGYNYDNSQALDSAEVYSLDTGRWRALGSMNFPRVKGACCANAKWLYAFGGVGNNTIEKLSLETELWTLIDMIMPVTYHDLAVYTLEDQKVLVLGGKDETNEPSQQVQVYDLERESILLEPQMQAAFATTHPPVRHRESIFLFNDRSFLEYHMICTHRCDSTQASTMSPSKMQRTLSSQNSEASPDKGVLQQSPQSSIKYNVELPVRPHVLVIKRPGQDPDIAKAFQRTVEYLLNRSAVVFVESAVYHLVPVSVRRFNDTLCSTINLVVTLGGDGTVLWAVALFKQSSMPPILSFNLGSLGFMTSYSFQNFEEVMRLVFSSNSIPIELSSRLKVKVNKPGEISDWGQASNEVCIDRGPSTSMLMLDIFLDGEFCTTAVGDGILIATPCGSTAYNLSAGGSLVHPNVPALLVTPICPHSLSFRPIVLPDSVTLSVRISEGSRIPAWVGIDGNSRSKFTKGQTIEVRISKYPVPRKC